MYLTVFGHFGSSIAYLNNFEGNKRISEVIGGFLNFQNVNFQNDLLFVNLFLKLIAINE